MRAPDDPRSTFGGTLRETTIGPLSDAHLLVLRDELVRGRRRRAISKVKTPESILLWSACREVLALVEEQAPEDLRLQWGLDPRPAAAYHGEPKEKP
jgi:hypothetical protein